jgi:hypothetical protein
MRARLLEAALLALVLAGVAALYADATKLSWTYDDAFLLRVVSSAEVDDYFVSPQFWRSMPAQMFVPLLLVWYEGGSRAVDDEDGGFYIPAIALLLAALLAVYAALRLWVGAVESLAGVAMIGLGPPVVSLVTQLMATHYLIALGFVALSVVAFTKALRSRSFVWATVSALFYLCAMLAKEVAIPLPALLLLLPWGRPSWGGLPAGRNAAPPGGRRAGFEPAGPRESVPAGSLLNDRLGTGPTTFIPHAIALILYFAWRKAMIGVFLGGYGWATTRETVLPLLRSLPRQWATSIAPPQTWIAVLLALVLLVPIVSRLRSRRFAFALLLALGAAILPVLPVSREMQPRYVFASWVTLVVFFVMAVRAWPPRMRAMFCAIGVAVVAIAHRAEWRDVYPTAERMSAEARFVLTAPAGATLRLPRTPPAAMGELQFLRAAEGSAPGLQWFYDDLYLCAGRHRGRQLYEYSAARHAMVDVTHNAEGIAQRYCASVRDDVPLQADFQFEEGTLHWTFGPYERGTWHVVFGEGVQAFTVPRRDAYILGDMPGIALRVRYDAPEGWVTYSPEIVLDFVKEPRKRWSRN